MTEPNLKTAIRHQKKRARLAGASCANPACGAADARGLQQTSLVLCAECRLALTGRSTTERHHPPGRHNDPCTAPLPANAHAVLSDAQVNWPAATLRNPNRDLLRTLAAWLRFFADTFRYLSVEALRWADELERRADHVAERLGPRWWVELDGGAS